MKKSGLFAIPWFVFSLLLVPASVQSVEMGSNVLEGSFSVSMNVIPKAANDDDEGTNVDDGAYMFRVAYEWTESPPIGIAKSSTAYYAVAFFKDVDSADDWVQSSQGIAAVYGNRYFLQSADHQGFGIGWYAGVATISGEGFEGAGYTIPYEEDEFQALAVAAAFYQYYYPLGQGVDLNVYPSVVVAFDTNTAELDFIPGIMVGVNF